MVVGIEHSAVNGQAPLAKPLWGFVFSARGFIPGRGERQPIFETTSSERFVSIPKAWGGPKLISSANLKPVALRELMAWASSLVTQMLYGFDLDDDLAVCDKIGQIGPAQTSAFVANPNFLLRLMRDRLRQQFQPQSFLINSLGESGAERVVDLQCCAADGVSF